MGRLTADDLAGRSLWRQFPDLPTAGPDPVLTLFERLGPVQSQVPRAPFLTASSRLPGTTYADVRALFASFELLKTTSLRGTVHTGTRRSHPWLDAVARPARAAAMRSQLGLDRVGAEQVVTEIEAYADGEWRTREELVAHLRDWLAAHASPGTAERVAGSYPESLVWGHSGLLRRPRDDRWEKRTDRFHRRARELVPALGSATFAESLGHLVTGYLAALGPATRHDLAYFLGTGLTAVDAAVSGLGEEVLALDGPDHEVYVDLAEPPPAVPRDLGVRLLPEFDALVVGYHLRHRTRFLSAADLQAVWSAANGQFAPVVLHEGRLVATWRTVSRGARTVLEVTRLPGHRPLPEDLVGDAATALGAALDLVVTEVRLSG